MFGVLLILCGEREVLISDKKLMREQNMEILFSILIYKFRNNSSI